MLLSGVLELVKVNRILRLRALYLTSPQTLAAASPSVIPVATVRETFLLSETIMEHFTHDDSPVRPKLRHDAGESDGASLAAYAFACTFFGATPKSSPEISHRLSTAPVVTCFEDLIKISLAFADRLASTHPGSIDVLEAFVQSQVLLTNLLDLLPSPGTEKITVEWNPTHLIAVMLPILQSDVSLYYVLRDH